MMYSPYSPDLPHRNFPKSNASSSVWSVILSGGQGTRMRDTIRGWLGEDRPKQYCVFTGTRSMLQHTLDRARLISPDHQILSVIGPGHRAFLDDSSFNGFPGPVIEQAVSRGTATGTLLSSTYVRSKDPNATVVVLPSDHYIFPEERLNRHLQTVIQYIHRNPEHLVVLGAYAEAPEVDYGWFQTVPATGIPSLASPLRVTRFYEKPDPQLANWLFSQGCLCNTMIIVAKVKILWNLGKKYFPILMDRLEYLLYILQEIQKGRLEREHEALALAEILQKSMPADFSKDLMQRVPENLYVYPLDSIEWSDWGRPERIAETLRKFGKSPLFLYA